MTRARPVFSSTTAAIVPTPPLPTKHTLNSFSGVVGESSELILKAKAGVIHEQRGEGKREEEALFNNKSKVGGVDAAVEIRLKPPLFVVNTVSVSSLDLYHILTSFGTTGKSEFPGSENLPNFR